jgi:hypothetical protein
MYSKQTEADQWQVVQRQVMQQSVKLPKQGSILWEYAI